MPTKPSSPSPLTGQALIDLSPPLADTPKGGIEFGFTGESGHRPTTPAAGPRDPGDFTGMGPWLEDDDATAFQRANNLVLRQELLAQNHLAVDIHYTRIKLGYPWSTLEKDANRDTYRSTLPAGTKALTVQAIPNQAWDLVNKATETVLADPPEHDPVPLNDSEEARAARDVAETFLTEDGGEQGTNDVALLYRAVDKSMTCATAYIEGWTDPVGGGYVPLQILAHPQATDPAQPLVGPDGMPTPNPVLRYVTSPEGGQFTDDPSQAAPQWQPKIRGTVWGREHWRLYPEHVPVELAQKAIGLLYCTIGEAKRRWPTVAQMAPGDLDTLLSWTPLRYLVLLPPFQRARWRISPGSAQEQQGSSDERILFYYRTLVKADPENPHGAEVILTGANGGMCLHKNVLSATVAVPSADGTGPKQKTICLDLPLAQVTPRDDPDERDPSGRCYMELFCGATEFNATLFTGFAEALDIWLHAEKYIPSTSSVQGFQVEEARLTGDAIPIIRPEDKPVYGNMPPIPPNFFNAIEWNDQAIRSIASLNKPVTGQDTSKEVSGKARQIAVQQAMVGLGRMQHPVNAAFARWGRLKLQLAMRDYTTPQMLRYVGEDGSWMEREWNATDFALIGNVRVQAGTGTMMPPDQKVQFLANLKAEQMIDPEEAAAGARKSYAKRLGLADDPHAQYIERSVTTWLQGPPEGWIPLWQQYQQQQQRYAQQQQQAQQQQAAALQTQQTQALTQQTTATADAERLKHERAMELETHKASLQPNPAPTMREKVRTMLPEKPPPQRAA